MWIDEIEFLVEPTFAILKQVYSPTILFDSIIFHQTHAQYSHRKKSINFFSTLIAINHLSFEFHLDFSFFIFIRISIYSECDIFWLFNKTQQ